MSAETLGRRFARPCAVLLLAALASACETADAPVHLTESSQAEPAGDHARLETAAAGAADMNEDLARLRSVTAAFHRFEEAEAAGHTVLVTHPETGARCLEHAEDGGMGRHYLNPDLVDDAVVVETPEVVIYEPQPNGRLQLVGFEYIIPFSIRGPDEAPPTLFGQEFLHNHTFDLWMLHVWTWKHNPEGMFATWNPAITCAHDDEVED